MAAYSMLKIAYIIFLASCVTRSCPVDPPCTCYRLRSGIDCSKRKLTRIPRFYGGANIDYLDLSRNNIGNLTDELAQVKPRYINLETNPILYIQENAFSKVKKYVRKIHLRYDGETKPFMLTNAIEKLENLEDFGLTAGKLKEVPASVIPHLPKLKRLSIIALSARNISFRAFDRIRDTVEELELSLSIFSRSHTVLQSVQGMKRLYRLKITHVNQIPPDAFKGLTNLKFLDLSRNDFSSLDAFNAKSFASLADTLVSLDLQTTKLKYFPADAVKVLKKLTSLNVRFNNILEIKSGDLSGLDSLKQLDFDFNDDLQFTESSFKGLEDTLEILSLNSCDLTEIPSAELGNLRALRALSIGKNRIKSIPADAVKGLTARYINLYNNEIDRISPNAFDTNQMSPSRELMTINLFDNQIRNVDFIASPCSFEKFNLHGNPIVCDCALFNVSKLSGSKDCGITGQCLTPPQYAGWTICSAREHAISSQLCPQNNREPLCDSTAPTSGRVSPVAHVSLFVAILEFVTILEPW